MKQRNNSKLDVFNPFLGLQPMLSPRSRTLPPIKRFSRDFRTSKLYPSRIPVRIPFLKEKQQRKMAFYDEVNYGIDGPLPRFSSNLQQRNRLCAKTSLHEEEWFGKKPEKEPKEKYFFDENSERIRVETSSLPSHSFHHRFEDGDKISQEKFSGECELTLSESSSWANSFDQRGTQMYETQRTENFPQKQPSIKNEWSEKRMPNFTKRHTRSLGRHFQPLQERLTECPEEKVREKRGKITTSLSLETPPSVVIDSCEEDGDFEEKDKKFFGIEKRVTPGLRGTRRPRTLAILEEKRGDPVKNMTSSPFIEKNPGILCKPKLHKIHSLPLTPHKTN